MTNRIRFTSPPDLAWRARIIRRLDRGPRLSSHLLCLIPCTPCPNRDSVLESGICTRHARSGTGVRTPYERGPAYAHKAHLHSPDAFTDRRAPQAALAPPRNTHLCAPAPPVEHCGTAPPSSPSRTDARQIVIEASRFIQNAHLWTATPPLDCYAPPQWAAIAAIAAARSFG
jgi:hypothetical protein